MPLEQPLTDDEIYQLLRQAIDESQADEIIRIFNNYPDLDWNHITPNGLSALWWALTPPQGKKINSSIVMILLSFERNGQLMIDPTQQYANLRPIYYLRTYSKDPANRALYRLICEAENEFILQETRYISDEIARDTHSASNPFIIKTSDENLKRLYQRYHDKLRVDAEIREIETFINSSNFQKMFPLASQKASILAALNRFKTDRTQRSTMSPEQGPCNLKEALALTWLASKETDPNIVSSADPYDRQKAVLTALYEAKTAYANGGFSCWQGIWGRIGTTLSYLHNDVRYQDIKLTGDLARDKCVALVGEALAKTYETNRSGYWDILSSRLDLQNGKEERTTSPAEQHWQSILPALEKTMRTANIAEEAIPALLGSVSNIDIIPLSRHEPSRQLELLQRMFHQKKKGEFFDIGARDKFDVNEVLKSLKMVFISECLSIPDDIAKLALPPEKQTYFSQWVLNTLLERRNEDEEIHVDDIWDIARTQIKIDSFKNNSFSNWYKTLELPKQMGLATFSLKKDSLSLGDIVEWAIANSCITGLSLQKMDLSGRDFRGWDLSEIDLSGANLKQADLRLIHANNTLWKACDLEKADFNHCLFPEALLESVHCTSELLLKQDNYGNTLLHTLVMQKNWDQFKLLLHSKHCSEELLISQNKLGNTALFQLIEIESSEVSKKPSKNALHLVLCSSHCTEKVLMAPQNQNNQSLLHIFARSEYYLELAKLIITSKNCTEKLLLAKDTKGQTILGAALGNNFVNSGLVNSIITSPHCTQNVLLAKNSDGKRVLPMLIRYGKVKLAKTIITSLHCTKRVLLKKNKKGQTPLHIALAKGHTDLVESIIASPHCVDKILAAKDNHGRTPLDIAIEKKYSHLAKLIIKKRKEYFLLKLKNFLNKPGVTRENILDFFKETKDKQGKYFYIHKQKNPKWDRLRLFFKSAANNERNFWHTATYQKAVKMMKDAYVKKSDQKISKERIKEEVYFINYCRGNSLSHLGVKRRLTA